MISRGAADALCCETSRTNTDLFRHGLTGPREGRVLLALADLRFITIRVTLFYLWFAAFWFGVHMWHHGAFSSIL